MSLSAAILACQEAMPSSIAEVTPQTDALEVFGETSEGDVPNDDEDIPPDVEDLTPLDDTRLTFDTFDTSEEDVDLSELDIAPPEALRIEGRVLFERRIPDPTRSFLDLPFFSPLPHHLIEVVAPISMSTRTDAEGRFSLELPEVPASGLTLIVSAVLPDPDNPEAPPLLAVFDGATVSIPGRPETPIPVTRPWAWSFERSVTTHSPDLGDLKITMSNGSGALAILDTLTRTRALALATFQGPPPPTLGILWSPQRAFSCLSCYLPGNYGPVVWSSPAGPVTLDRALFVSGTPATPHHWVTPILAHELGHWVADVYSRLPEEGGPHAWDSLVRPELAFAEGFATFFALWSLLSEPTENPSRFFSVQQNIQYWIDFERLGEISPNLDFEFPLPYPNDLAQPMNESIIVAILWDLFDTSLPPPRPDDDPCSLGDPALEVIAHPRLVDPSIDRGAPGPDLVDYLDALACASELPDATCLDIALFGFPYDNTPLCESLAPPVSPR